MLPTNIPSVKQFKRGLLVLDQAYVKEVCKTSNVRLEYSKLPPELEAMIPGLRFYEKWFITSVQNPSEQERLPFYQWLRSGMLQSCEPKNSQANENYILIYFELLSIMFFRSFDMIFSEIILFLFVLCWLRFFFGFGLGFLKFSSKKQSLSSSKWTAI
jgi:hypothetical protein